jgi:hypothetical protein
VANVNIKEIVNEIETRRSWTRDDLSRIGSAVVTEWDALRSALSPQAAAPQAGAGYEYVPPSPEYCRGFSAAESALSPRVDALESALSSAQARVAELEAKYATAQAESWETITKMHREEIVPLREALHIASQERDRERAARESLERALLRLQKWKRPPGPGAADTHALNMEQRAFIQSALEAAPPRPATAGQDDSVRDGDGGEERANG